MGKKKGSGKGRDASIRVKVSPEEKALYESVGSEMSENMSQWVRGVLNAEIKRIGKWPSTMK